MDIVERIRQRIELFSPGGDNERLLQEAADLIERQQRHIDRLTSDLTHAINEVGEYQRGER